MSSDIIWTVRGVLGPVGLEPPDWGFRPHPWPRNTRRHKEVQDIFGEIHISLAYMLEGVAQHFVEYGKLCSARPAPHVGISPLGTIDGEVCLYNMRHPLGVFETFSAKVRKGKKARE